MKLMDYTGRINDHNEYLLIIKKLENKCKYIEYVIIDEDDNKFIKRFENHIISKNSRNKWWGTETSETYILYKLKATKEVFNYLMTFETFCKCIFSNEGDIVERTSFGINDIVFFDDEKIPLLFTTTHEGYITIRDDLVK